MSVIERSETFKTLGAAMLKVQSAVSGVTKDSKNDHFKSKYASLENVVSAIRPACLEAGLLVTQAAGAPTEGGLVQVETLLIHTESGEWMRVVLPMPVTKADAQGVGSAITYACRYSLMAMFNIPPVDDDGNAATRTNGGPVAVTLNAGLITDPQIKQLQSLIVETGTDLPKFLRYFKINELRELSVSRFDAALAMLNKKAAA